MIVTFKDDDTRKVHGNIVSAKYPREIQRTARRKAREMTTEKIGSIHPGEILQEDFLGPMGVTAYQIAKGIHVPQTRISQILKGERAISADTAHRLARFFGTSAQLWINLQAQYDLEEAETQHQQEYDQIPAYA